MELICYLDQQTYSKSVLSYSAHPPLSDRPIPTRGTPPKHRIVSKYLLAYQKTVLNL